MKRRAVPVSDEVLRSLQMTAGNQAVGRAIAEGRVSADGLDASVLARPGGDEEAAGGDGEDDRGEAAG